MTSAVLAAALLLGGAHDEQLRAQFRDVRVQLEEYGDMDAYHALAAQLMGVVQDWALHVLESQPDVSAADLERAIQGIVSPPDAPSSRPDVGVLRLRSGPNAVWVVTYATAELGTFFVIAREDGRFRVAWDVKKAARQHGVEMQRWGPDAEPEPGEGGAPFVGDVHPLPPAANGNLRFYVDAATLPYTDQSRPGQISVWEWDGWEATPVFMETYTSWTRKVTEDGDRLRIAVHQTAETFHTCGGVCETTGEPTGTWMLRITPEGVVVDEGRQWDHPELALLDALMVRVRDGTDASDLATASVVRTLRAWLRAQSDLESDSYPLQTLVGYEVLSQGAARVLEFSSDVITLKLTLVRRAGRLYATAIWIQPPLESPD